MPQGGELSCGNPLGPITPSCTRIVRAPKRASLGQHPRRRSVIRSVCVGANTYYSADTFRAPIEWWFRDRLCHLPNLRSGLAAGALKSRYGHVLQAEIAEPGAKSHAWAESDGLRGRLEAGLISHSITHRKSVSRTAAPNTKNSVTVQSRPGSEHYHCIQA
jgi:hypothetical protein